MSKLSDRLRRRAKQLRHDACLDGPSPSPEADLYEEAADEIVRLLDVLSQESRETKQMRKRLEAIHDVMYDAFPSRLGPAVGKQLQELIAKNAELREYLECELAKWDGRNADRWWQTKRILGRVQDLA